MSTSMTPDSEEVLFDLGDALEYLEQRRTKSERLAQQMEQGVISPVGLAKALEIKPQMVYNYIRDGKIPSFNSPQTQHKLIHLYDAVSFIQRYLNRKALQTAKIQAELRGE